MKAVIYARVSSKEQEETGYSLPAQEKFLTEYASRKGFAVVKVFSVAESASGSRQRKVFAEMMDYLVKNKIPHLLCEKVDRLTRNFKEAAVANEWLETNPERHIHFVKQNLVVYQGSRSDEDFRWDIEVVLAKKYIGNLSEEVKKGQKEKIAQGWLPTKPPLGYKTIGEKGHKTHEIEETKSRFVKRMFELYGSGLYSLESLRQLLAKEGLRSRGGSLLSKSRTAEILGDPFYVGKVRWNGKVYPGKQEALVSNELFEAVQRILKGKTAPSKTKHFYLLSGFVRCEDCGGLITWERQKKTVYGHCNTYRACAKRKWYKEADFETVIKQTLFSLQIEDKVLAERLSEALRASYKNTAEYRQKALQELNACVDRANQRLERLYDDKLDGKISTELYEKKQAQFAAERDEALAGIKRQNESVDQYRELSLSVLELSQRAGELYEHATDEEKRKLVRLAFEKMTVKNGQLVLSFNEAFRVLYGLALEANGSKVFSMLNFEENISEPSKKSVYKRQKSTFVLSRPILLRG